MPRTPRTARERAEYRLGVAQRAYENAVRVHAAAEKTIEATRTRMTDAATTLAHRQADPALQDTGEES